jgi:DNA-directed RNA polymerase specialized sigma24 family protein
VVERFEEWYRAAHPKVIGVVFVACGDADVAEDTAAEAFTRALDRWGQIEAMASPDAWVCRVAVNVMRRRVRRRQIERRLLGRRTVQPVRFDHDVQPEVWMAVRSLPSGNAWPSCCATSPISPKRTRPP